MTEPVHKIWGTTQPLIVTPMFEMHRLVIKAAHRCSFHVHRFKHNAFYTLRGFLYIDEVAQDHQPMTTHFMPPHDWYTVAPGVYHQFRTSEAYGCTALEMYFTEPLSEDILRRNVGGPA